MHLRSWGRFVFSSVLSPLSRSNFPLLSNSISRLAPSLAPFVETSPQITREIIAAARLSTQDVLVDVGCGDGRICIEAARTLGVRCIGLELDPRIAAQAKQNVREQRLDRLVRIEETDALQFDLAQAGATVVTMYLSVNGNARMRPHLEHGLRPGARVISYNFEVPGWEAREVKRLFSGQNLYIYTCPFTCSVSSSGTVA